MTQIKMIRKKSGVKAKDVARSLGLTAGAYSIYETGSRPFPAKHIEKLAKFYGITMEQAALISRNEWHDAN